ncbi:alpha-N-acetyl-neuraminyl-2,3-beta-galactosyl-1,3-N-acetyl-galactosaminide alpha-2,6-sialyltransferase-like [Antedon mediterranea]|uniref:alpha-N-acetyl-neuraminyl-2,3-beta-galactosyl-1, 3-N-acetyl-galactosaminide alpha-2,6-sialyltransferase-like n=1 Tax=Antedon mediterranea TaxID=105859 RepID=UPI003AF5EFF9
MGQCKLHLACNDCTVVASSGHLLGSNAGREIDQHHCVIRMNLASVVGFEHDVGTRTTIRVVGHRNFNKGLSKKSVLREVLVPKLTNEEYRYAFLLGNIYKDVPIYSSLPDRIVKEVSTMLTTGWYTMVHAMEFCPSMTVYWMVYEDFCSSTNTRVPYHYYDKTISECTYYNKSENKQRGGHLFITEKAIFRRWSTYKNITFRHPVWPKKVKKENGTLHTPFLDKFNSKRKELSQHRKKVTDQHGVNRQILKKQGKRNKTRVKGHKPLSNITEENLSLEHWPALNEYKQSNNLQSNILLSKQQHNVSVNNKLKKKRKKKRLTRKGNIRNT